MTATSGKGNGKAKDAKKKDAEKSVPKGSTNGSKKGAGKDSKRRSRRAKASKRSTIIREPLVAQRLDRRSAVSKITSNGTIAAAVMVAAALLAVVVANSPAYPAVHHFLETPLAATVGPISMELSLEAFINDFLMAVFFLLVGIELKYEMTVGQLRRPRQAALPMLAAVGGVAVPAFIFLTINPSSTDSGWAIPIATDIAFALGVMSLLGDRVAPETKVFFQTLAIADDILAIVVLALFYGQTPNISWCAMSLIVVLALAAMNGARVYSAKPYVFVGLLLWVCMYKSGIHATLSGVILAFFLPARSDVRLSNLSDWLNAKAIELDDRYDENAHILGQRSFTARALQVERVVHHVTPPLQRVERYVSTLVNFFVLPVFAFANAQVRFVGVDFTGVLMNPVTQGAYFGAMLGKPIGIILVTLVLVKIRFAKLPRHVTWDQIIAVGIMGSMGFTMSILIAGLAFPNPEDVMAAKVAILLASFTSAIIGIGFVRAHEWFTQMRDDSSDDDPDDGSDAEKSAASLAS